MVQLPRSWRNIDKHFRCYEFRTVNFALFVSSLGTNTTWLGLGTKTMWLGLGYVFDQPIILLMWSPLALYTNTLEQCLEKSRMVRYIQRYHLELFIAVVFDVLGVITGWQTRKIEDDIEKRRCLLKFQIPWKDQSWHWIVSSDTLVKAKSVLFLCLTHCCPIEKNHISEHMLHWVKFVKCVFVQK